MMVEKLRTPLLVNAIYFLLLGVAALSPSIIRSAFGYEVKDAGLLLMLSAAFLGSGVVAWRIAGDPEKHGSLASAILIYLVIFIVFLLWGWGRGLLTFRNVFIPLIVDIVLVIWIWSAGPKS